MTRIQIAAAVLNQTPLDWASNEQNILAAIHAAKAEGVTVLCLPELCITGYGCEDAFHGMGLPSMAAKALEAILPTMVPQSMEARTIRPQLPFGR
jgi:NAD+ synthase (glutamine-hydrolysing)